ncbi:MAG: hypothetical protein AAF244_00180 [Pseudomonadota bacterium]
MSREYKDINLRVTFIGAVEHIKQIEAGVTAAFGLEDVHWVESNDGNIIHLDFAFPVPERDRTDTVDIANLMTHFSNYFTLRAMTTDESANKVGIMEDRYIPRTGTAFSAGTIQVKNTGSKVTDSKGVERYHASAFIDGGLSHCCKLSQQHPA